ncbi:hypothetical protein KC352_g44522, partial [Hortaea werneckii]
VALHARFSSEEKSRIRQSSRESSQRKESLTSTPRFETHLLATCLCQLEPQNSPRDARSSRGSVAYPSASSTRNLPAKMLKTLKKFHITFIVLDTTSGLKWLKMHASN